MKVAILGFGKEGESAYNYYSQLDNELTIHDNDTQKQLPQDIKSVLGDGAFIDLDKYGYDLLVRSPGVRVDNEALKTTLTTPTAEFMKLCPAPIIGVTGTKGKGTTATLIEHILVETGRRVHLLGNIGSPALDELGNINPTDIVVLEMSSFQLFDLKASPHVAVCLMVTEDHLDWHKSLNEYHISKGNIFKFQKPSDIAIYYSQNAVSQSLAGLSPAETKYSYGKGGDVTVSNHSINAFGHIIADIADVKLPGEHNLQNICAAICGVWPYTQDTKTIKKVIKNFAGLPYHIEHVLDKDGVNYYNDSFSTNPTSAIAAVVSFTEPLVLFLGGYDKQADFSELATTLKGRPIRKIITFAETGQRIAETLASHNIPNVEYISGNDFKLIVKSGISQVVPGDIVLLSPACASWGMFTDYKARGQQFNDIITLV